MQDYLILGRRLKASQPLNVMAIILSCLDLLFSIAAIFFSMFLLPALLSSIITGIILCIGYGLYDKLIKKMPFAITQEQTEALSRLSTVFGKQNIILSILDVITGIIAIAVVGIFVNDTVLSVVIGTLGISAIKDIRIVSTAINSILKLRKSKIIYTVTGLVSISYITIRENHFLKKGGITMKKFFKWLGANPKTLTAILSILGAVGLALLEYFEQLSLGGIWTPIITALLGTLGVIFAGWAGFEYPTTKKIRDDAVKTYVEEKKANEEYLAEAQAQLQAQQDAQIKALAEKLKTKSSTQTVTETKVKSDDNIPIE